MTFNARIQPPPVEELNEVQKKVYDATVKVLGAPIGPRMVLLKHTAIVQKWSELAAVLKAASFPDSVRELVILLAARHWDAEFEWYAHEPSAVKAGVPREAIEAIRNRRPAHFSDALHAAVYRYVVALLDKHHVDDDTYRAAKEQLGEQGLIEATVLLGHYSNVALTLIAHQVALPEGVASPWSQLPQEA
jgi:4-carboxymuconolactone decarboxylase